MVSTFQLTRTASLTGAPEAQKARLAKSRKTLQPRRATRIRRNSVNVPEKTGNNPATDSPRHGL